MSVLDEGEGSLDTKRFIVSSFVTAETGPHACIDSESGVPNRLWDVWDS